MSTYGDIGVRTAAYAATDMLAHAEPVSILSKFGLSKPLPKNKTDTIKYRRPVPFDALTAPLAEGVTPNAGAMSYAVNGRQYVAIAAGTGLFVFALP